MSKQDTSDKYSEDEITDIQDLLSGIAYSDGSEDTGPKLDSHTSLKTNDQGSKTFSPPEPQVSALDVAEYILRKTGRISTMKLQKLVYYCQVWSLVWDEAPLFQESIESWANGPVIRELFNYHCGMFDIEKVLTGNPALLSAEQVETIDAVIEFYGDKQAQWLIDLSHSEEPWQQARRGIEETERGSRSIPLESMANYYSSLMDD